MKRALDLRAMLATSSLSFAVCMSACTGDAPVTGMPSPLPGTPQTEQQVEAARISSGKILKRHLATDATFAMRDGLDAFEMQRVRADEFGLTHVRTQQLRKGVPVWGGQAVVHLRQDGSEAGISNDFKLTSFSGSAAPTLTADLAILRAIEVDGCGTCLTAKPGADLWIMPAEGGAGRLVWRVRLSREDGTDKTSFPVIFIDAHSGDLVWSYDNLQSQAADDVSIYSGVVSVVATLNAGLYNLEDRAANRKTGTFNMNGKTTIYSKFFDANNKWGVQESQAKAETPYGSQQAGVDAHFGVDNVLGYYSTSHGRNGLDGNGGPFYSGTGLLTSFVHYGRNYANAYWSGSYMVYGDGDGTNYGPFVAMDICGHEMTHGVTQFEANLTYSGESGALNESMSDVFGELIELHAKGANDWLVGKQVVKTTGAGKDAIRYMLDPHQKFRTSNFTADDDPDHYSERYTGGSDNGGVHVNSGISNKAFTLVAVGGTHHKSPGVTYTGIGTVSAGKIWYKALADYMTSSTNFAGARTATLSAAKVIFPDVTNPDATTSPSPEYQAVAAAWGAVGVN